MCIRTTPFKDLQPVRSSLLAQVSATDAGLCTLTVRAAEGKRGSLDEIEDSVKMVSALQYDPVRKARAQRGAIALAARCNR